MAIANCSINSAYREFVAKKSHSENQYGIDPVFMPDDMFDFQKSMTEWALRQGRAALFEDCGLGKTFQELVWAENIVRQLGGNVLIVAPLAVSVQTIREGEKFGIECKRSVDGTAAHRGITITNYERLHLFCADDFVGVCADESSILKNFAGARRGQITQFMRQIDYRLLATATAAPNDYIELGTSSEALGYLGYMDMLNRFFRNERNNSASRRMYGEAPKWEFKGHSELPFWRWVTSWARALRKPSDIGFNDDAFTLPGLTETDHLVKSKMPPSGMLFDLPAITLEEQRAERKRTINERCEYAANLVNHNDPAIVWCHLNAEGDLLEKLIPDAVQVSGAQSDEAKETRLMEFADRNRRVLIIKPKIGAFGLNFQHCNHVVYFPSHSYEQKYQAIRRCWRFGQKRPVQVDLVMTEGDRAIIENLGRKSDAASAMFERLVDEMNNALQIKNIRQFDKKEEIPAWL